MLKQAFALWQEERQNKGTHLQRRLMAFFALSGATVILMFVSLLLIFGITGSGTKETKRFMENELAHISQGISEDFGKLSLQGVALSEDASAVSEAFFKENNITAADLQNHTELIEPFLACQMQNLTGVMEREVCSGVFLVLDVTVNTSLPRARYSKAGVFLKKTDPNTVNTVGSDVHYLRGPAEVARKNGIDLLGQWKMEFDTEGETFFTEVMDVAKTNPDLPLSRLYYWSNRVILKDNSEAGLLLCVPIKDKSGAVFAVYGIEVSDRQFKRRYSPDNSQYANIFTAFAPWQDNNFLAPQGMIAGNYYLTSASLTSSLTYSQKDKGFWLYEGEDKAYGGLQKNIKLYPSDSPYSGEKWVAGVMMDQDTLAIAIKGNSAYLLIIVIFLSAVSLGMSTFISRRYLRPVTEGLNAIKAKNYGAGGKNTYVEINDLMEFLALQEETLSKQEAKIENQSGLNSKAQEDTAAMFTAFLQNIQSLSPAEKSVFDLYLKGYHAQEIADELCLSINTIKTHNRRIFSKLEVSTRKELLVYLDMMKKLDLL